ncbi:DUF721 domain-containing protein [Myroides ceti]|uniref:DUF721 domain-containing protein n=1 Tax=Paenimyroides ceti TaxID=395087 RepID=A0ABT8CT03_9FLAO|nr:DUF721 domain-containing protein [Paenimyroides ceti]MDN3707642.1 DUF721 domain-containing protein [Paenimyroides ceti]
MSKKFNPKDRLNTENDIQSILNVVLQGYNLTSGIDKINVKDIWKQVMGSGVANYTLDVVLKKDVLYVALSSAVLREELSYGKDKIIKILNEELQKDLIREIILR